MHGSPMHGSPMHGSPMHGSLDAPRTDARTWNVDPFSTGFGFAGWKERAAEPLLGQRRDTYEPLVVYLPKTWLLRVGWRKHGLIAFHEVPSQPPV